MEEWRVIEENPLYEVSDMGRVRVKERVRYCGNGNGRHVYPAKIMSTFLHDNGKGNKNVVVQMRDGSKQIRRSVAILVLLAFVGKPIGDAKQPRHKDGDALNNQLENLEWDYSSDLFAPINEKARELYIKEAYGIVRGICLKRYYIHKPYLFGGNDNDDLIQDCMFAIWKAIDLYDENHCTFYTFCKMKVDWVFCRLYRKMKRRNDIASITSYADMEVAEKSLINKALGICSKGKRKD